MFAKLKQGLSSQYLYYAPKTFITPNGDVIENFDTDIEKLFEYGFKMVIDIPPEIDGYSNLFIDSYLEDEDIILIIYDTEKLDYNLEQDINDRIATSKSNLETYLDNNPLYSEVHGDGDYYTVTLEKQSSLLSTYNIYKMLQGTNYEQPLMWNAKGKASEVWEEEEFIQLISEVNQYVKPLVVLQQVIEEDLKKCTTRKEVYKIILTISIDRAHRVLGDLFNF